MCLRIIALAKIHLPIHSDLSHCHEKKSLPLRWGRWRSSVNSLARVRHYTFPRDARAGICEKVEEGSLPLRWGRWRSSVSSLTLDSYFNAGREGRNLRESRGGEFAASLGSLALLGKLAYARLLLLITARRGKQSWYPHCNMASTTCAYFLRWEKSQSRVA